MSIEQEKKQTTNYEFICFFSNLAPKIAYTVCSKGCEPNHRALLSYVWNKPINNISIFKLL